MLFSKFMTSETGQKIITLHILHNIPRSEDNQAMKFRQVIEYNVRNIFLEKLFTKYSAEASLRPFYKK